MIKDDNLGLLLWSTCSWAGRHIPIIFFLIYGYVLRKAQRNRAFRSSRKQDAIFSAYIRVEHPS
jgi:hypothetical protein